MTPLETTSRRHQSQHCAHSNRLNAARAHTDALFRAVRDEFLFERPIAERHRLAFYIGHLEAFDWNLFARLQPAAAMSDLDQLFAFGIDPVDGELPSDRVEDWPRLGDILAYRDDTRARVDALLQRLDTCLPAPPRLGQFLHVAIEHRLMHAETMCYLMHQLPFAAKIGPVPQPTPSAERVAPHTVNVAAGDVTLGLPRDSHLFGWDNEFEAHEVHVPAFRIDACKVSNRQFLDFIDDGGYQRRELWNERDWRWKTSQSISHPAFWMREDGAWLWRSMFAALPLPLDWPVYVSHAEANAYARWAGRALPTEAQWQRAAVGAQHEATRVAPPDTFDPQPLNSAQLMRSACGAHGMYGNGWEWTCTPFAPFAGFEPFDFYPGYSAGFFDERHFVLKGGSVRSAPELLRPTFRNWFQPHYPYVYAGFRCVDCVQGGKTP